MRRDACTPSRAPISVTKNTATPARNIDGMRPPTSASTIGPSAASGMHSTRMPNCVTAGSARGRSSTMRREQQCEDAPTTYPGAALDSDHADLREIERGSIGDQLREQLR